MSAVLLFPFAAHAALTIEPLTWNIIGLDSNDPATGPNRFPVGARVCSSTATTNVSVNFVWDSANPYIDLRPGSLSSITFPVLNAGECADAYFEVEVDRDPNAYETARRYHITATDSTGTVSTPTPRELYVEYLISQSRNSISDVRFGTSLLSLTSVAPGGSMDLVVGNTYYIQLVGGTATQGYNQFEEFINFPNTVFQVLEVDTTYSADNSPYVPNPNDRLYADACLWENDPNSPNYRACVGGDFKAGGNTVITTYTVRIVSGGGTTEALSSLLYDFSGSSFHYNADFGTSARIATISDPTLATIAKNFNPDPASVNGTSTLTFTLGNPNPGTMTGYAFVDNLPANLVVAATPNATTSGCGTPSLTATAGSGTITFSNGTVAAGGSCVISVNVTPTATGTLTNTTSTLIVAGVDTGKTATDTLTVTNEPAAPAPVCGVTMASWPVPAGSPNPPVATLGPQVAAASVSAFIPADTQITTSGHNDTGAWQTYGYRNDNNTLAFTVDTTNYSNVQLTFWMANPSPANGPTSVTFEVSTNGGAFTPLPAETITNPAQAYTQYSIDLSSVTASASAPTPRTTTVRMIPTGANADAQGASLDLDDIAFTGCATPVRPTMTKSFSPDPIAVGATSTLTFTLTNTNATALTGAAFTDTLPSGVQVAATPSAATTCGGTWAATAGATTLTFAGGTIPAAGSCTVTVNVTATTAGAHPNVSGYLSTTETGQTTTSVASDVLTAIAPPVISKNFDPSPILPGGISTLTFIIENPNTDLAQSGVAFTDTFPSGMVVAAVPNATTSGCGSPTFAPAAAASSVSFSGGTIAAGGTCTVTVDVTAPSAGSYINTTGNVSHVVNAQTVNGNTATDTLTVEAPAPSVAFLKQVGPTATGPWTPFLATTAGAEVFYRFTIENTGDVALTSLVVDDDTLDVSSCNASLSGATLPAPVAANENHIVQCVVGPVTAVTGAHVNEADVDTMFGATEVDSEESRAEYATTGLTLDKSVSPMTYAAPGETLNYSYLVTNSGFAPLEGPVTVTDDKATVTCPAVTTVGDLDNFLDPSESITCTASYLTTAGDVTALSVTNTATATVDGVSSNSDTATATVTGVTLADVSVVKTLVTAGPYAPGQSISYTLLVANGGPSTATNVQVTDTPSNLTITGVSGGGCAALPCTIASLASGASVTVNVTATIIASGAFDNSATVAATETDPNLTNNTDNTGNGGTATPSVDVSLVKTLTTSGPYTHGQVISYSLLVANAGPSTATSIQVTDTPSNLTITGVSGACAALPCTIASLASGANTSITVTATINGPGAFDNSATALPAENDPNLANNTDNTGNGGTAGASADMAIVKTLVTAGPYSAGQSIAYTLLVTNNGPSTATTVQVTDTPSNLTITGVSGGGCAALPCTIASMAAGASVTINVTATIVAAGAFDNVATVSAVETDPNLSNNVDNAGNGGTAAASADLSIVKTLVTPGPYLPGQSISYTLLVANAGPSTATTVQVTDTPTNLTITAVSGGGCAALPCTIASLASGASVTINVTATIVAPGAFDNVATVSATELDPNLTNNTDNDGNGGITGVSADVSLVKTLVTAGPFIPGQTVNYTIVVSNAGPSPATNVQVTDTPANLTITGVSGGGCAALPCTIPALAVGASVTINVSATIVAAGAFDNAAAAMGVEPDPNTTNNNDSSGNGGVATPSADVSLVKTLTTGGPFAPGQSVTFTLVVSNAGPSTATTVQVTDTPANLTVTGVSGACAALPCTIASIASGASVTINVTATIVAAGAFDNSATALATEPDPNLVNNTDPSGNGGVAVLPPSSADVRVTKSISGPIVVGQPFDYILTVVNGGPATATSVTVTDVLPAGFSLASATSTQGTCSGTATVTCSVGTMALNATVTITIRGTATQPGSYANTATVTAAEPDPVPTNNTSTIEISTAVGIPTLEFYALAALAALLALVGVFMRR
ncbi:MAG TPA: DUF11 domain-containing protein [Thermoanaerobaculia bacterium]|nr:DUF11 domain-containing protein [Thermoanaerobaculia bacterium]